MRFRSLTCFGSEAHRRPQSGNKAAPDEIAGWKIDARGDDRAGQPLEKGTVDDDVYALTAYILKIPLGKRHLNNPVHIKPVPVPALALALLIGMFASISHARAQSAAAEGRKIAFDRGKGNCLTCHQIKGGDLPGTIGPALMDIKSKYPDRNDLVAIVTDETKRNPQTVMPPFGRNRILTEQEINAVVDFLQTL
jgi:sulfur-oxidizing protein SoxX